MKAILFRLAAVLISFAIVALLVEVALRLLAPHLGVAVNEKSRFYRFDRELGWAPIENITWGEKGDDFVHQNQFGLRGPDDMQLKRTSGGKRTLVLGDSYVWGVGVSQEELFTTAEVHGTNQEYLFYLLRGQKFDVDQVVVAFTLYNDVENNLAPKQYSYLKPYFTLNGDQLVLHDDHVRYSIVDNLRRNLKRDYRVWNLADQGVGSIKRLLRKQQKQSDVVAYKTNRKGIELTLAILKKLKEAVEARHAEFYVVFVPYKPHVEDHLPRNHPFAPLIAAGLTQMGVSYREPYPEFLKSAIAGVELFNVGDNHFNAAGHALFAKFVTDTDLARASTDYYAHQ